MRLVAAAAVASVVFVVVSEARAQTKNWRPTGPQLDHPVGSSADEVRKRHSCTTRMTRMMIHGTQVSYSRPDGAIFLWYPGNSVVLQGQWEARPGSICFRYGTNTYNPATKVRGGAWACMLARDLDRDTVETVRGDLFGLARRTAVPFVLPGVKTTFAELQEFAKLLAPDAKPPEKPDDGCPVPHIM